MRLFFGVSVPAGLATFYENNLMPVLCKDISGKYVEPYNLHVTLLFLGELNSVDFDSQVKTALRGIKPFEAAAKGYGYFGRPPRVVFMTVSRGAMQFVQLHDALCGALGVEDPRFVPHITLVRVKRPPCNLDRVLSNLPPEEFIWTVDRVTLFESKLTSKGPIYTTVKDYALENEAL